MSTERLLAPGELRPVAQEGAEPEIAIQVDEGQEYSEIEEGTRPTESSLEEARSAVRSSRRKKIAIIGGAVISVVAVVAVIIGVMTRTSAVGPSGGSGGGIVPDPAPAPAPEEPDYGPPFEVPPPVTVRFNESFRTRGYPLFLNDRRISKAVGGFVPEQVHLTYVSPTSVYVSWVTGNAFIGRQVRRPIPSNALFSIVDFGTAPNTLNHNKKGNWRESYQQVYGFRGGLNYTSALIHHVKLENLQPETTYYYRVGDPFFGTSHVWSFTTLPAVSPDAYPVRLAVVGDLGQTTNSTETIAHVHAADADAILYVGDYSYADMHLTNDRLNPNVFRYSPGIPAQSYQPRWDTWGRLLEPLLATKPLIGTNGNHEIEPDAYGRTFQSYNARYPVPHNESGSASNLYYSWELGPMHGIMLSSYAPFEPGSEQYAWLLADLKKVDRKRTPWLVASVHAPFYNTYTMHYKENECMRLAMERVLFDAGVDILFAGHVHGYERTNPVFNYHVHACGPVQLMVGDGGNVEGLEINWVDDNSTMCPDPNMPPPPYQPQVCRTFQNDDGGYCPTQQPMWSAYREPSFGHGELELVNGTHALWQWHRNQDGFDVVTDEYYIERRIDVCPNKLR